MPRRRSGPERQKREDWKLRIAPSRRQSARYSRVVGLLRVVLPAVAVGLLALVALWPQIAGDVTPAAPGGDAAPAIERPHMLNPRYYGTDSRNRPFQVRAERATYLDEAAGVVHLEALSARMALPEGPEIRIKAEEGLFNRNSQEVELQGGVTLRHSEGHVVETSRATIQMRSGVATGNEAVVGHGPFGDITGSGFEWRNEEGVLKLKGPARMVLTPADGGER